MIPFWSHQTQSMTFFPWISRFGVGNGAWLGSTHCFLLTWLSTFHLRLRFSLKNSFFFCLDKRETQMLNRWEMLISESLCGIHLPTFWIFSNAFNLFQTVTCVTDISLASCLVDRLGSSSSSSSKYASSTSTVLPTRSLSLRSKSSALNRTNQFWQVRTFRALSPYTKQIDFVVSIAFFFFVKLE